MIHGTIDPVQPNSWQSALSDAIHSVGELLEFVGLTPEQSEYADLDPVFPLRVPRGFARQIQPGNADDPILRQVLPTKSERNPHRGFLQDPIFETRTIPVPGLIHKYHGRVLLVLTSSCAINCRYCFRRHFPYADNRMDSAGIEQALDYLHSHPDAEEVILSGGDPLLVRDERLQRLFDEFARIPHLKRVRIHSRTPVVIPQRLTQALTTMLAETPLQVVMVVHVNHANEITAALESRLVPLRTAGITVLNQSVLLAGINDNADTLVQLSERLFAAGILPYYLHLLDKVAGAAHFDTDHLEAQRLMGEVASRLPGYLVPKLASEQPGKAAKSVLAPLL